MLTIIINYNDSSCVSAHGDHVQRVCWLYHQLECFVPLHNVISQDGHVCHTDNLALYSCVRNYHFTLK